MAGVNEAWGSFSALGMSVEAGWEIAGEGNLHNREGYISHSWKVPQSIVNRVKEL